MPRISIFLQYKIVMSLKPELDNWLKNFIDIHLQTHFAVCISRYFVEVNVGVEVMPNSCPTVIALFVFFGRLLHFFYTVLTIAHAGFSNHPKLVLGAIVKMYFVTEPNSVPILLARISFKHNCSPIHTIFCGFFIHPPSPTSDAFMIVHRAHCSLHCTLEHSRPTSNPNCSQV